MAHRCFCSGCRSSHTTTLIVFAFGSAAVAVAGRASPAAGTRRNSRREWLVFMEVVPRVGDQRIRYLVKADLLRDSSWSPGRSGSKWEKITSAGIDKPEPRADGSYEGGHVAAITDLIEAIEKGRETKCSAGDGTAIVEMIAAVFESHRVSRPVELPLKTRVNPLSLLT